MHTKNHENCSQIEYFISQKPLAPNILSQTVMAFFLTHFEKNIELSYFMA